MRSLTIRVQSGLAGLSAAGVAGLATLGAVVFTIVRLWYVGGGPGAFVVAGSAFTDPNSVPGGIPVIPRSAGYDGQFFYRLAHDPTALGMGRVHGIAFDYAVRPGRILYPALVWMVSLGGRAVLLPWAMILVNIAGVAALGYVGARLATDHGRAAVWGLAIAGYWGFGFALARDLAEIVTAAAVFTVMLLVGRTRYGFAGLVGALAVSGREQAMGLLVAIAVGVFVVEWRRRSTPQALRSALATLLPGALAFGVWQSLCRHVTGEHPFRSSSRLNSTWPFADVPGAVATWGERLGNGLLPLRAGTVIAALPPLTAVALVALVGWSVAGGGLRAAWAARPWEPLIVAVSIVVLVSSSSSVLDVPADFRQSSELAGASWMMIWAGDARRRHVALAYVVPVTLLALSARSLVL